MEYKTVTSEDMENVGKKIAANLHGGDVVLLYGELGTGKTTLTKGISKKLGIKDIATSPTFTLMNVYKADHQEIKNLIHVDTYRLRTEDDLVDTGITDYLGKKDTLCIIEWPDKVENLIKKGRIVKVTIDYLNKDERKIIVENGADANITFN